VVFTVTERPDDSLGEAVRNRALTEGEAQVLTESVLRALVYLHEHGFAHRAVSPDNIVAVGDDIKLAPWTIARATGKDQGDDMFAVGQTIAEVLTQKRPTGDATLPRSLPQPFADVARACIRKTVEAPEALRLFRAVPEPVVARKFKLPTAALVALSLAVVALLYGVRSYTSSSPSQAAPPAQASPVQDVDRGRNVPPAAAASVPASRSTRGEWVVVAEIYKQHDQAMKRAEQIAARWKGWRPEVYPPNPGGRRFLVVLGFSETRSGGEQLLARARSAGMGKKVYLTRLQR
jgi:serine/threonine protein kinase